MPSIDAPILGRMLRPFTGGLRDDLLRAVADLQSDPQEEARYHELADRNAEGEITPEERRELEANVSANMLLSVLRAEARATLHCRISRENHMDSFHVEHVTAKQHRGVTTADDLAFACPHCNMHKGPNLTGIDPDNGEIRRLFDPRRDLWTDHFQRDGLRLVGRTPIGRVTVWVLDMNAEIQLRLRSWEE